MDVVIHLLRLDFIPADWWNIVFRWAAVVAISFPVVALLVGHFKGWFTICGQRTVNASRALIGREDGEIVKARKLIDERNRSEQESQTE